MIEGAVLETDRLRLHAATPALARADLQDRTVLARLLQAEVSPNWPPEFYDEDARRWVLIMARENEAECVSFYVLLKRDGAPPLLIGSAGFKGMPENGVAETGYSLVPEWQRQGLGTELVAALLKHAFERMAAQTVCAHTFPELIASQRVLQKNGFVRRGISDEEGAIRFEISSEEWRALRAP